MKVTINIIDKNMDETVVFNVHEMTEEVTESIHYVTGQLQKNAYIIGKAQEEYHKISIKHILYIESVEKKQFIYTRNKTLEIKERLYQLEEMLPYPKFIRVSKSMILNIDAIASFIPKFSGNMDAKLINDERVNISRRYVSNLKTALGMRDTDDN